MTAMSGLRASRLGAFRARAIPQFQVTMRRCAMFLSLADGSRLVSSPRIPNSSFRPSPSGSEQKNPSRTAFWGMGRLLSILAIIRSASEIASAMADSSSGEGRLFHCARSNRVYLSPVAFGGANSIRSTGTKVPGVRPMVVAPPDRSVVRSLSLSILG
jgi:hypothetical protein